MSIEEIKVAKSKLENDIKILVGSFNVDTGCRVEMLIIGGVTDDVIPREIVANVRVF